MSQDISKTSPNLLLAAVAPDVRASLESIGEMVETKQGEEIYSRGGRIDFAYLPMSGCLSDICLIDGGEEVEVGTIGWEGMVGLSLLHGVTEAPNRCVAQIPGLVLRIPGGAFIGMLRENMSFLRVVNAYAEYWTQQSAICGACNACHSVAQRCCRWLLMTQDRLSADVLPLTQEYLSIMLGVRRASVSIVAEQLQRDGLIAYTRGRMTILDHDGLVRASCGCYGLIRECYQRLLPRSPLRQFSQVPLPPVPSHF